MAKLQRAEVKKEWVPKKFYPANTNHVAATFHYDNMVYRVESSGTCAPSHEMEAVFMAQTCILPEERRPVPQDMGTLKVEYVEARKENDALKRELEEMRAQLAAYTGAVVDA